MTALRTAFFKQLATDQGTFGVLVGILITEGLMSFATSSSVGFRARKDHMVRFDLFWAFGAMNGVLLGLLTVHAIYHAGKVDPVSCLFHFMTI